MPRDGARDRTGLLSYALSYREIHERAQRELL